MKYISILCLFFTLNSYAQKEVVNQTKHKFFVTAGYGLAGSFFVTGYQENLPFATSSYKAF